MITQILTSKHSYTSDPLYCNREELA
jgi:hypothetical protein